MPSAAARDAVAQIRAMPREDQKFVAGEVQSLHAPTSKVNDAIWLIVVLTFTVIAIGGLAAVIAMVWKGKSIDVVAPFVTLAIGILGGLLAPSPVK